MMADASAASVRVHGYCALCISRCGCIATVEGGRLTRIDADPEHPTGSAVCIKAKAAPELVRHPDRLTMPLVRTRPKGESDPGWVAISWDEALDLAARRLRAIADAHGARAVAFAVATPSGTAIADSFGWVHRLVHAFGSPNLVFATENCNWHKDFSPVLTWGAGIGMPDYDRTRLILHWGFNPAVTWLAHATATRAAQRRGAKLVVIDPRRRGLGRKADLWLAPHPGTDGAVALGLAHLLLESGGADLEFLRSHSDAPFLVRDDNGRLVSEADLVEGGDARRLVCWDEWHDRAVTYDPVARAVVRAADPYVPALSGARRLAGRSSEIGCRSVLDTLRERCAEYSPERVAALAGVDPAALRRLAGWLAREGPVSFFTWTGTAQQSNATQTTRAINVLYALTGCLDAPGGNAWFGKPPVRDISGSEWVSADLRAQTLGSAERPLGPPHKGWITTRDLFAAIVDDAPYSIKALVSFGGNSELTKPATNHAATALRKLELCVMTEMFLTPSCREADLVLPVASAWEREGLQAGFMVGEDAERRVQLRPAVVPPCGESRADTDIIFALAQRLGLGDRFFGGDVEAGLRHQLEGTGLSPRALRAAPRGIDVDIATRWRKYQSTGFATPSGKLELHSSRLAAHGADPLPHYSPPLMGPEARPDLVVRFTLRLTSAKWPQFCHSQQRQLPTTRRSMLQPLVELHPETAAARGIAEGDRVEILTPHGHFVAHARLTPDIVTDTVCAQYGWWLPEKRQGADAVSYNAAIDGEIFDPLSGSNTLRAYLCEVVRLPDVR